MYTALYFPFLWPSKSVFFFLRLLSAVTWEQVRCSEIISDNHATKSFPFFFPTMSTCKWTSLYRDTVRIMDGVERALRANALSFRFQSGAVSFTQKKRQFNRRAVSIDSKFNRALGFPLRFCGLSTSNITTAEILYCCQNQPAIGRLKIYNSPR